jgi:hypothetical protein
VQIGRERGMGKYYRPVSPEWVVEYLEDARFRMKKERFLFWDDIFPYEIEWVREFSRLYKERIGLPFSLNFHPKLVIEENVRLLVEAGMDACNMGFQSGSARIRKESYGRHETNEQILRSARILGENTLCCYDLIIDNPYETPDDLRESLELFLQFTGRFIIDTNTLLYFRNQDLTRKALQDGRITEDQVLGAREVDDYQDVTCTPMDPRTRLDSERRALMMLVIATQYDFIPRDDIRRWGDDKALLADDRKMALRVLSAVFQDSRRRRHLYAGTRRRMQAVGSRP